MPKVNMEPLPLGRYLWASSYVVSFKTRVVDPADTGMGLRPGGDFNSILHMALYP